MCSHLASQPHIWRFTIEQCKKHNSRSDSRSEPPGIDMRTRESSFALEFSEDLDQNWGGPRASEFEYPTRVSRPNVPELFGFCWFSALALHQAHSSRGLVGLDLPRSFFLAQCKDTLQINHKKIVLLHCRTLKNSCGRGGKA